MLGEKLFKRNHTHPVFCISWSPDSKMVASSAYNNVRILDVKGTEMGKREYNDAVRDIAWSHNGNFIAVGYGRHIPRRGFRSKVQINSLLRFLKDSANIKGLESECYSSEDSSEYDSTSESEG